MKSKLVVIFLVFLSMVLVASAQDSCQYTTTEEYYEEELVFYKGSTPLDGKLELVEWTPIELGARFKMYNSFGFDVQIKLFYETKSSWYGNGFGAVEGTIPSKQYSTLESHHNTEGSVDNIQFSILSPGDLLGKSERVTKERIITKTDPNCNEDEEDVRVEEVEEKVAVTEKKEEVNISEPKEKASFKLSEKDEEILGWTIVVLIIGIFVVSYIREKQNERKYKELERKARAVAAAESDLAYLKNQMGYAKNPKEVEEMDKVKTDFENLKKDINIKWREVTRPHPDPQVGNRLVIINPHLGGYKCFYEKGLPLKKYSPAKLIHIWMWKKHHGRWPKRGYHIHHKDGDKYNNHISNLEEIEGKEHYENHRLFY